VSIYKVAETEADLMVNECVEVAASSPHEAGRKYAAMGYDVPDSRSVAVEGPDGTVTEVEIHPAEIEEGGADA
jgi:hypothetical protein